LLKIHSTRVIVAGTIEACAHGK